MEDDDDELDLRIMTQEYLDKCYDLEKEYFPLYNLQKSVILDIINMKESLMIVNRENELVAYALIKVNVYGNLQLDPLTKNEQVKNKIENKVVIHLLSFVVNNKYRGKGIGRYLLENIIERTKQRNSNKYIIILETDITNKIAIRLYEKIGFKIGCVLPNFYEKEYHDGLFMYFEP